MSKPFWKSRTFWGAVVTGLLGLYGGADQTIPFMTAELSQDVVGVLTALSAIFTVWARSQAEGPIHAIPNAE